MCVYDFNDMDTNFDINFLEKFFNDALIHKEFDVPIDAKLPCNQIIHVVFNEIKMNECPDIYKMWLGIDNNEIDKLYEVTNEANKLLRYLQDLRGVMPFEPCEIDFLFNNNNCTKDYDYYDEYSSDGEHYSNHKYRNKNVRKLYKYIHDYVDCKHRCNSMF